MAKKDVLQEVKDRMQAMKEKKAAELDAIKQAQTAARADLEAAAAAIKEATEHMNIDAYETATAAKRRAQTVLNMYDGRLNQIQKQEYISEAESDAVIDSLLAYEKELEEGFKTAAAEPLKQLAKIHAGYLDAVKDTESVIDAWQRDIHANYNTRGGASFFDEFTGQHINRSPAPIPVHRMPYTGCSEAAEMGTYLEKAAKFFEG